MTELLRQEEDLVVRLAAAQTLKDAVDDFEFCPETFMPFLPDCFSQLFRLLQEARECDTKMQVGFMSDHFPCWLVLTMASIIMTVGKVGNRDSNILLFWCGAGLV